MNTRRKVAIATGSRAERSLLEPIFKELRKLEADVAWLQVEPGEQSVFHSEVIWENLCKLFDGHMPDVILIPCDRAEMISVAAVAYYLRIPIFHMYAGVGPTGTDDDVNRRVISSFAYVMAVEDDRAKYRLIHSGEQSARIKVVGSTHADGLELSFDGVPKGTFDLVLLNGNPGDPQDELKSIKAVQEMLNPNRLTLWIEPSTPYRPGVAQWIRSGIVSREMVKFLPSQPRPRFLAMMKNCRRFITNSSSAAYEPHLVGAENKVVPVGERNFERITNALKAPLPPPAAEKVADLLVNSSLTESRLKRYGRT